MYSFTKWKKPHEQLAKDYLQKNSKLKPLPTNIVNWIEEARPIVENKKRNFLSCPFWLPIYNDPYDYQMIIGGRQIYKSTACTDFLAFAATSQSGVQVCYVTYDQQNLSTFSKQKLKIGTFSFNPILAKFLRHPGNVGEISLKNNSTIYLTTDNYQYRHLEGKSPTLCVIDEAQYQEMEHFGRVHQTMMATKGKVKIFGIGGESGSPYEKLWRETNQMEWHYENPNWRERLQFDQNGLVIGDYLKDELKGKWVPQNSSGELFHGYHIPQTIVATIPLTEEDAIYKYHVHPRFSIEYQEKTLRYSDFKSHVLGEFYNSPHRPVTKEMLLYCTEPYRYLSLLKSDEIKNLKELYGDQIIVSMGVDFGSGKSSSTVIAIVILWQKSKRVQLVFIEKRPPENQLKQAQYVTELFKFCACDIGVGDLGYGANQIKVIQDGGYSVDSGEKFDGVTYNKFYGCRSISDYTKPLQTFNETIDEHGDQVGRVQIDKTSSIEFLLDAMQNFVHHPKFLNDKIKRRPKLMIPSKFDYEVNFLLEDMLNVTRKDVSTSELISDPRQHPRKEFNHPPDSVMALIYALTAINVKHQTSWNWISG